MAPKELTPMQQRFVQEYLLDLNAKQAAIRAGYSKRTAQEQSSRLLSNVKVQRAIAAFMDEIRTQNTADIQEIMEYLTAVMRGKTTEEVLCLCGEGCQKIIEKTPSAKDRIRAAELLGKRYGLFTSKVDFDGTAPVVIIHGDLEPD